MKHNYYAVYDVLAETYMPPNELTNNKVAIRAFKEACKTVDGYKQHAEDMEIFKIFEFDDSTGEVTPCLTMLAKGEKNE